MSFKHTASELFDLSACLRSINLPDESEQLQKLLSRRESLLKRLAAEYGTLPTDETEAARKVVDELRRDAASLETMFQGELIDTGNELQDNKRRQSLENGTSAPQCLDHRA